jgi:hypothetical protein
MSNALVGSDDGWSEIIGDQVRGGATVAGLSPDQAYEVLGAAMQASPAFQQFVARRAAASRPMLHKIPLNKARDWQIDFGPAFGLVGSVTTLINNPQCLFRGEKVMATDSGTTAGYGTRISQIFVGQKLQRPAGAGSTLTAFFANNALGNGIKWDTCEKALSIAVTVQYAQSVTFDMSVFGKAVLG